MRRIALYSDVHANLPALEAVYADMDAAGVRERYCLGDLVGYGPYPAEAIERIRASGDRVVQGNYDRALGARLRDAGSSFSTPQETLDGAESYAHTIAALTPHDERYLSALARGIVLDVDGARVLLCHGSPRRINETVARDTPGAALISLVRGADVDAVCCGHTHVPFHRAVPTGEGVCHWINAGSVGRPRDGDPRAAWVELSFGSHAEVLERAPEDLACRRVGESDVWLSVRIHRIAYDTAAVMRDIVSQGLPATLAAALGCGSENHQTLVSTSLTQPTEVPAAPVAMSRAPLDACESAPDDGCGSDGMRCTCAWEDRVSAYECFESVFRDPPEIVSAAVRRLEPAMRTCRAHPQVDDDLVAGAYRQAVSALATPAGRADFEAERERLYGRCRHFDPFTHVLSASELTYLEGDLLANRAELEALYASVGFVPVVAEDECVAHISVEMAFMAHCLRHLPGGTEGLGVARDFFVGHLADWAVLFAVVTVRNAQEPVMRYAGLALDKYLACEAATFRTAVPQYCEMRDGSS